MGKPKIRFKGYADDWEQRKLGDIITEYKETVDSDCTLPILTSSKTEGVILQEEHFGRKQQHDITGYNILPRNYCTYRNRSDGVDFTFNINKCCDKGIISKFYPVFSGKNSDVFFLSLVLNNSDEVVREIAYTCTGTGQKVLAFLDLQKMKVRVPNFAEQKEIAAYFERLDHLITLHQRKCDETKKLKKYMLQKMFPQNGEKVPKIRFAGFSDDWEQRKFSDIAARESAVSISASDIPSVEYEDVVAEEGRLNKDIRLKDAVKSGIIFDGSQVLYGKLRPYLHNWLNPDFKGIAVGDWWVLKPINIDKNFLYRLIQTQQFDNIANQSSGSKMPRADWNLISNSEFMLPFSKEEQSKIGGYLHNLDYLITLHQQKCNELQNIKKFMLKNMFA